MNVKSIPMTATQATIFYLISYLKIAYLCGRILRKDSAEGFSMRNQHLRKDPKNKLFFGGRSSRKNLCGRIPRKDFQCRISICGRIRRRILRKDSGRIRGRILAEGRKIVYEIKYSTRTMPSHGQQQQPLSFGQML